MALLLSISACSAVVFTGCFFYSSILFNSSYKLSFVVVFALKSSSSCAIYFFFASLKASRYANNLAFRASTDSGPEFAYLDSSSNLSAYSRLAFKTSAIVLLSASTSLGSSKSAIAFNLFNSALAFFRYSESSSNWPARDPILGRPFNATVF